MFPFLSCNLVFPISSPLPKSRLHVCIFHRCLLDPVSNISTVLASLIAVLFQRFWIYPLKVPIFTLSCPSEIWDGSRTTAPGVLSVFRCTNFLIPVLTWVCIFFLPDYIYIYLLHSSLSPPPLWIVKQFIYVLGSVCVAWWSIVLILS